MSDLIHPTAIVHPDALIAEGVEIGAYAYIGPMVEIGEGCRIQHHATIDGKTVIGRDNEFYPYCCVGLRTQDKKYRGGEPGLRIGDRNTIREFATIHTATEEGSETLVGSDNLFLAYVHIAHDCVVGNHVIISNNGTLAGHVIVEDRVVLGGLTGVHQFCRLGEGCMIGACSKVAQDVPPFTMSDGHPLSLRGLNKVGMERAGFSPEQIKEIRELYRLYFRSRMTRAQVLQQLPELEPGSVGARFCEFIQKSTRGCISVNHGGGDHND